MNFLQINLWNFKFIFVILTIENDKCWRCCLWWRVNNLLEIQRFLSVLYSILLRKRAERTSWETYIPYEEAKRISLPRRRNIMVVKSLLSYILVLTVPCETETKTRIEQLFLSCWVSFNGNRIIWIDVLLL